ncbi:MAG TPA: cyclic pyranopterin monophosphate synthase MoaC [Clostridia bacterium]|nr:cyclic pyranopterin monophosphate synthase MoaC [Clostridia bacterium]
MRELTHLDQKGRAQMVDVGTKEETQREAVARGFIEMQPTTLALLQSGRNPKGDVLAVARVAGIIAAKRTADLIPLCHPLLLTGSNVDFRVDEEKNRVEVEAAIRTTGKTGVEMEALTAASVALLTIYDMCKAVDKGMVISNIRLIHKRGGQSGEFNREGESLWEK